MRRGRYAEVEEKMMRRLPLNIMALGALGQSRGPLKQIYHVRIRVAR